jgi:hypothetical protein
MDWIERWFGVSPDGGDGSTEALYIVALFAVMVLVFGRQSLASHWRRWWNARR